MPDLSVAWDSAVQPLRVRVWDDELAALDVGDAAADWFTHCLNPEGDPAWGRLRLVRFDPQARRVSDRRWTGEHEATTQFADGERGGACRCWRGLARGTVAAGRLAIS
jgi:uncharacterized protein YcbX